MFVKPRCLAPEQQRALSKLEELFPLIRPHTLQTTVPSMTDLCLEGNAMFVNFHVNCSDLPRGNGWHWNQSRNRLQTRDTTGCMDVVFFKLVSRRFTAAQRKKQCMKLWIYQIAVPELRKYVTVLWCEKGDQLLSELFSCEDAQQVARPVRRLYSL